MQILPFCSARLRACAIGVATVGLFAATGHAEIEIQFSGMNLVYDGTAFYDAGSTAGGLADPADADPLATVNFFSDGSLVGSLTNDISLDVFIPGVTGISSAAGTVYNVNTPNMGGFFDLLIGTSPLASEFLLFDIQEMNVTYVDVGGVAQFTFGATISDEYAQNLPFGLELTGDISLSFSAQVDPGSLTSAGGFLTGFTAFGTGEYSGAPIPAPSAWLLLGLGLCGTPGRRRR